MLQIVARESLANRVAVAGRARLLLEGSWSAAAATDVSLDDSNEPGYESIDAEAATLANRLAATDAFLHVNALRLRYAAVKWLRVLRWWRARRATVADALELHLSTSPHDDEYAALWQAVATAQSLPLSITRHSSSATIAAGPDVPLWRRAVDRLLDRKAGGPKSLMNSPRVLLCGNPRILAPVCEELLSRDVETAWLFDRPVIRPWLYWRRRGVQMISCRDERPNCHVEVATLPVEPIMYDGVDLAGVVAAWRAVRQAAVAARQRQQHARIAEHVTTFRPTHLVVDEDATPLPRMLLAAGRDVGAASAVVQHGACGIRFGFTPLAADRFFASDEGSRRQMEAWGVDPRRIAVTGSPYQQAFVREAASATRAAGRPRGCRDGRRPQILLLGTTPPRDDRPDAMAFRFTTRSYEAMLAAAFTVVSELAGAELVVRSHPRAGDDPVFAAVRRRFPSVTIRMSKRRESLARQVVAADCVLSCASSSGIEAARAGRPVIQLLPPDSGAVLPADWYGLFGEARSTAELRPLLHAALSNPLDHAAAERAASHGGSAASKIVDELLDPTSADLRPRREVSHA